jgi:hypothetical protein
MNCEDAEQALASLFDVAYNGTIGRELLIHLGSCCDCRDLWSNLVLVRVLERIAREYWGGQKTCQLFKT